MSPWYQSLRMLCKQFVPMLCKKFAKNLQVFYKKFARKSPDFLLYFYPVITEMLIEIKQISCTLQMTLFQDILRYMLSDTVLLKQCCRGYRKLQIHIGHSIE